MGPLSPIESSSSGVSTNASLLKLGGPLEFLSNLGGAWGTIWPIAIAVWSVILWVQRLSAGVQVLLLTIAGIAVFAAWRSGTAFLRRWRQSLALLKGTSSSGMSRTPFTLSPWEGTETQRAAFTRPDSIHEQVEQVLAEQFAGFFCLTGASGVGKSSLLRAYVIPRLKAKNIIPIVLRAYDGDILERISTLARSAGLRLASNPETPAALVDALAHCGRVLLVFDQFEDFLLAKQHTPRSRPLVALNELIKVLAIGEHQGIVLLLSLREEYTVDLETICGIRDWRLHQRTVGQVSLDDATRFLRDRLDPTAVSTQQIVAACRETSDLGDLAGKLRLVVVNMLGLALQYRSVQGAWGFHDGDVLLEHVEAQIARSPLPGDVMTILRSLLKRTDGVRSPRSTEAIAAETRFPVTVVDRHLLQLASAERQLVRLVYTTRSQDRLWTISHDFVAELLERALPQPRQISRWAWVRRPDVLTIATTFAMILMTVWTAKDGRDARATHAREKLANEFGIVLTPVKDKATWKATTISGKEWDLDSMVEPARLLSEFGNVSHVELTAPYLTEFDLSALPQLKRLSLKTANLQAVHGQSESLEWLRMLQCPRLETFPSLDLLPALSMLDLSGVELWSNRRIESPSLRFLHIGDLAGAESIPDLGNLPRLERLTINRCSNLEDVPDVRHLTSLITFRLQDCPEVTQLPSFAGMSNLRDVVIARCSKMERLPSLDGASHLESVFVSDCKQMTNCDALAKAKSLAAIVIISTEKLTSLPSLEGFPELKVLEVSDCRSFEIFPEVNGCSSLIQLGVYKCPKLSVIPPLRNLPSLLSLEVVRCEGLVRWSGFGNEVGLERIEIRRCSALERLPDLSALLSLKALCVAECGMFSELVLDDVMGHLRLLSLDHCPKLTRVRFQHADPALVAVDLRDCSGLRSLEASGRLSHLERAFIHGVDDAVVAQVSEVAPKVQLATEASDPQITFAVDVTKIGDSSYARRGRVFVESSDVTEEPYLNLFSAGRPGLWVFEFRDDD